MSYALSVFFLGNLFLGIFPQQASAAVSSNTDYLLQFNQINTETLEPTPKLENMDAKKTNKKIPPYTITSTNDSFSFELSQTNIDFGSLSPTNPVIRTSEISFSNPLFGAQVIGYENHPLTTTKKEILEDTTCDNGLCTQEIAASWTSSLAYGFGYRCESDFSGACNDNFSKAATFKQLPDRSANESEQAIILNQQTKQTTKAKIIYKINISGTQPHGDYSNTITYIAIPNF